MYTSYFGLTEKPFAIAPNPKYLYMSDLHKEALAHLIYGINSDGCFILLTGNVGTGKTTICRCLLEQLPKETDIAIVLNPKVNAIDLLKTICQELNISISTQNHSIQEYINQLNSYLLKSHACGRNTAILIDEAQNLDIEVLEQLRLLTNLETNTQKLLRIILIGQPELKELVERHELSQLNQRITSRYHLAPLRNDDISSYIQHRITIAGGGRSALFSEKAITYIAKYSKGIPRLINILCDRALLGAYAESTDQVNDSIIKKAAKEILPETKTNSFPFRSTIIGLSLIVLIFAISSTLRVSPDITNRFFPSISLQKQTIPLATSEHVRPPSTPNHLSTNTVSKETPITISAKNKIIFSPPVNIEESFPPLRTEQIK